MLKILEKNYLHILILFICSFFLIFYQFNEIPKNLAFDEVEFAKLALSLNNSSYTPYSPLATGHTTLYFYLILLSFKIFGINNFALRFPSALFGIIIVPLFFLIMKKVFKSNNYKFPFLNFLPLYLSLMLLSTRWFFNFARFSFEATFLLFLELLSIIFLINYIERKKFLLLFFSFVFAALTFHSYTPGRVFFILPLIIVLLEIFKVGNHLIIKHLIISLMTFILIILPLIIYFFYHPDIRFNQQFFLSNNDLNFLEKGRFLGENILKTILMFFWQGDVNGRHNYPLKPALNPILFFLFFLGLIQTVKNFRNFYSKFFILYFFLSIIPTIFTYPWENPNMLRTFTAIPSIIFFVGQGIVFLVSKNIIKNYFFSKNKLFFFFLIIFFTILSSFYELRTYFKYQKKVFEKAFDLRDSLESYVKNDLIKQD